jgi:hypothetical protein
MPIAGDNVRAWLSRMARADALSLDQWVDVLDRALSSLLRKIDRCQTSWRSTPVVRGRRQAPSAVLVGFDCRDQLASRKGNG